MPPPMRCLPSLLLALLLALPAAAQPDLIQPTDLFQIRQLGGVAVSPSGEHAVYTVKRVTENPDEPGDHVYRTHLWLAPLDGSGEPRPLTRGEHSASSPVWHPGGDRIAFVRAVDGKPQVHLLPLDGGEPYTVTALPHGATSPQFSPDGRRLLVASSLPMSAVDSLENAAPTWDAERPGRRVVAEDAEPDPDGGFDAVRAFLDRQERATVEVTTRLSFQGEQALDPEPSFQHLYVIPLDEVEPDAMPEPQPLTRGHHSYGDAAWLPDGRVIAAARPVTAEHPDRVLDRDLLVIGPGEEPETLLDLEGWALGDPAASPDGERVAFLGGRLDELGFQQAELGVLDLASGQARWLTDGFDRSVSQVRFAPDGRHLYFVSPADGGFPLYRVALDGGAVERLTDPEAGVRAYDLGPRGAIFVLTTAENPYELYAAAENAEPRRLTGHNARWLEGKRLSLPERRVLSRVIPLEDGDDAAVEMDYFVMEPTVRRPGERYPLMLQIHGGPSAMWGPGEATMWHEFQMLAARGYGIVYANPRGSGGYGRAFRRANERDWGHGPASDVLAALDATAAAEDWADPERLVVTGGSYAGYLTAWIAAHTERFRAAVAQRGVYDLQTFLGEGNAWRLVPTHFGGYPWEPEADSVLAANSPLTFVDRITTPLLIIHASEDLRTGVSQSEMLYRSLKVLGRPVEYARYPGAGHDLSRAGDPDQRLDRLLRIYEFVERYAR